MKNFYKYILILAVLAIAVFFPPEIQKAQAAISFRGTPQIGSATDGGNVNLTFDVTPQTGDVVFVFGGRGNTTDAFAWGPNTPGYATTTVINSTGPKFGVWYKVMGASPDTTVQGEGGANTASGVAYGSYVIDGRTIDPAIFDQTATSTGQTTFVPDGPAIVTQTPGAWVITHAANFKNGGDTSRGTVDNYIIIPGASVTETDDFITEAAYREVASPGTEDPPAWSSWASGLGGAITIALKPAFTFIGNDTDPGVNPTIAPGAATTTVGTFNLKTNSVSDTVTNATTTLSAGSSGGLFGVEITNSANTTIYCSSYNPSSDTVGLTGCNLPVTTASTTFNIRIKPKTHGDMPVPPGSTYSVTALITAITSSAGNTTSGVDTTSDTVTIDNASPNGATNTSGTAGNAKVTLNWIASNSSSDFDTTNGSVILRWADSVAGQSVPAEGNSSYSAGNTIATSTVACVISSAASASLSKIDGSGGDAGCTTDALTNNQAYTYKVFQRDTNGNYDAGTSIGSFTPVAPSAVLAQNNYLIYENKDAIQPDYVLGSENASTTVAQGEVFRIRMNLLISGTDMASSTKQFKLQFNTASSTSDWIDVGLIASTTSIFSGYDNSSTANNATITAALLSDSNKFGTYQEQSPSDLGHQSANSGQTIEYDWVVLERSATTSINYYFRMVKSNGTALDNYNTQAIVTVMPRTFTQRNYQWFINQNLVQPSYAKASLNTTITNVNRGDLNRLRVDMLIGNVRLAASSQSFVFQYKTIGSGCGAAETWYNVGNATSTEIWRFYDGNYNASDGALIASAFLDASNILETYEQVVTLTNPNAINVSQAGEWDFPIYNNGATDGTTYCFRIATASGADLNTYTNYVQLTTAFAMGGGLGGSGGSAMEISPAGPYQTPTTTPSGGAPAEPDGGGTPTTTPNPEQGGGGGDSSYAPMMRFLADIGYFFTIVFQKLFYSLI